MSHLNPWDLGDRHEAVLVWFCILLLPIVMDSEIAHMVYILVLMPCSHHVQWGPGLRIAACSSDLPLASADGTVACSFLLMKELIHAIH